jgi:shikimate kinase
MQRARVIVLLGPRGVGKTTIARAVAARLGRPAVDLDAEIERAAGKTIAAIFAAEGEPGFRDLESRELASALAREDAPVIATGGGVVMRVENREEIAQSRAFVVYLGARPETLAARIQADPESARLRPQLVGGGWLEEARRLLEQREPLYLALAAVTIETDALTAEEVAARVALVARERPA